MQLPYFTDKTQRGDLPMCDDRKWDLREDWSVFSCKTLSSELLWADREERAPSLQGTGSKLYKKDDLCVDSASCYLWRGFAGQSLALCGALGSVSTEDQEKGNTSPGRAGNRESSRESVQKEVS